MILRCASATVFLSLSLTFGCQGITSSSAENHAGAAGVGFETGGSGAEAGASGTVSGRGGDGAQAGTSGAGLGGGTTASTCSYAGRTYADGKSFASEDGCNTCSCANGLVACTERACVCDPAVEHWRDYVTTVPSECEVIDYACLPGSTQFENACGCGCEQSPDCPEFYDCMPTVSDPIDTGASSGVDLPSIAACPTPEQSAACPLTQIAY